MASLDESAAKTMPTIINEDDIEDVIWVEYFDETKKKPYYYNKETKATTWTLPPDYAQWKDTQMKEYLKISNWKQHIKPDDGRIYYSDKITKTTQWNVPDDVKEFERMLIALTVKRKRIIKRKVEEPAVMLVEMPVETMVQDTTSSLDMMPSKVARLAETDESISTKNLLTSKESFGALVDPDDSDSDREEDYVQDEDNAFGGYKGNLLQIITNLESPSKPTISHLLLMRILGADESYLPLTQFQRFPSQT